VLRYSGFPLFLRKCSHDTQDVDIAFKLFFGIPILIVEHHNIFSTPQTLIDAVHRINRAAPEIRWSGAGDAVKGSYLRRKRATGPVELRTYARSISIENPGATSRQFHIEWSCPGSKSTLDGVYRNGCRYREFSADDTQIHLSAIIDAGNSETFSIRNLQTEAKPARIGLRYSARAFIRRRLSEARDNYVSKSPALLATAKSLQRRLQH
jgi:hypothetical protein